MTDFVLFGIGGAKWLLASAILIAWVAASAWWLRRGEGRTGASAEIVIAHASQTGTATNLAGLMKKRLDEAGRDAVLVPLAAARREQLMEARQIVIVAATTGAGEAPDPVRHVERTLLRQPIALSQRQVLILGLGDRSYEDFCAFGFRLKAWAENTGATVAMVAVDNQSARDLAEWDALLEAHGLPPVSPERERLAGEWTVQAREPVAQGDAMPIRGSRSGPLFHVRLEPAGAAMPDYRIGDLFEWHGEDGTRRDFSIASLPQDDALDLFVRRVELPDGGLGKASSVLTRADGPAIIRGLIRPYPGFHETAGGGPLLAIAAGSGWGGIRPHVLEAARAGRAVWLIYGERGEEAEPALLQEIRRLHEHGDLARLDLALSRVATDGPSYVQDVVESRRSEFAGFLGSMGAVVVCGAVSMGKAVEQGLADALPGSWIETARASDRWRSALY